MPPFEHARVYLPLLLLIAPLDSLLDDLCSARRERLRHEHGNLLIEVTG